MRLADRNAIAQGHSRSSGRLSSDEKRLLQSSHSNRSEKVQTQNERHKQSRKTTFQTVANNQESQVLVIVVINMIYYPIKLPFWKPMFTYFFINIL